MVTDGKMAIAVAIQIPSMVVQEVTEVTVGSTVLSVANVGVKD